MVAVSWYLARLIKSKGYFVRDSKQLLNLLPCLLLLNLLPVASQLVFLAENNLN
jgi:hypothetical protein